MSSRVERVVFRVPVHRAPITPTVQIPAVRCKNGVFKAWLYVLEGYVERNPDITVREWVDLVNPYVV